MVVDEVEVVKIGVTTRKKVEERVLEILESHYKSYRYFCYCKPKRFRSTEDIYEKEKMLHDYFEGCRYVSEKRFQGNTELFRIDDTEGLLDVYARVIDGEVIEGKYTEYSIEKALDGTTSTKTSE